MAGGRNAGVIGWPVAHSRSPVLHAHWLRSHGIAGTYVRLPVPPGRLEAALRGLAALGFAGANVTVPHKEAAARLVDHLDPVAAKIGSVNLITVQPDGSLHGASTDGFGFLASLAEADPMFTAAGGPAVVLGAGGAARAIVAALLEAGVPSVRLVNRSRERADALAAALAGPIIVRDWAERAAVLEDAALLVNTTSLGMTGQPPLDLALDALPRSALVSDIVYVPAETGLLAAARARGNRISPGLPILMHQARPAFAAWFGIMPDITPDLRAEVEATL